MHKNLYVARRENRLLQKDVAKKIGMSEQSYHLKETGQRDFTIPEGKRLAKVFNCTLNDLFADDEYIASKDQAETNNFPTIETDLIKTIYNLARLHLNK